MELEDEHWRLCSTTVVRGVAVEPEDENWRHTLPHTHTHDWKMSSIVVLNYI